MTKPVFLILILTLMLCGCSGTNNSINEYSDEGIDNYIDDEIDYTEAESIYSDSTYNLDDADIDDVIEVIDELEYYTALKQDSPKDDSFSQCTAGSGCRYNKKTKTLLCSGEHTTKNDGCSSKYLSRAIHIVINGKVSKTGLKKLKKNKHICDLSIKDMSNFSEDDIQALYNPLARNDIAMAALLFSHEKSADSYGNNGKKMYRLVMKKKCPQVTVLRSCASVVSGAMNAAGASSYASAATADLVSYYKQADDWKNLGRLPLEKLQSGDIIFIDRKSHSKRAIHDHICVWVGNEKIKRLFPSSTGNIVSGSYDENYSNARSASVSTFDFKGDYRVYRHFTN